MNLSLPKEEGMSFKLQAKEEEKEKSPEELRVNLQSELGAKAFQDFLEEISVEPQDTILLVGGAGFTANRVARLVPEGKVFCVEKERKYAENGIQLARSEGIKNIQFWLEPQLTRNLEKFDHSISILGLTSSPEPNEALALMVWLTRQGGTVSACESDWGGYLMYPDQPAIRLLVDAYIQSQRENADLLVGRKLFSFFSQVGSLEDIRISAKHMVVTSNDKTLLKLQVANQASIYRDARSRMVSGGFITERDYEEGISTLKSLVDAKDFLVTNLLVYAHGRKRRA